MSSSPLVCPITLEIMTEPVLAPDGYTYEKSAIQHWLSQHGTSPQTRQRMTVRDLVPNRAIHDLIEEQRQRSSAKGAATYHAKTCSDELYETIVSATKATVHVNAHNSNQSIVHVETPNISDTSASSHICCVIDVSGSMATEASCKDENGLENRTGLSILDIVKFATLVISKSLESKDKLSIVTYSTNAATVLEPTVMNEEGKKKVANVLSTIQPQNMTNLWDGMKMAIELANDVGQDYINSIFVLTDGIPNVHPPLGYERSMDRLLKKSPLFGTLSTFGFGYNLDSPLLAQIAKDGGGYFSFIPDAGFVGTCFINAVANARCSFGILPALRIVSGVAGDQVMALSDYHKVEKNEDGTVLININQLRYGAPIDLFISRGPTGNNMEIELVFKVVGGKEVTVPVTQVQPADSSTSDMFHSVRDGFVEKGLRVTSSAYRAENRDIFLPSDEAKSFRNRSADIDALCKDMEGQATEAVSSREYYDGSWGRHYLFSLVGAHLHQFCNNFKDPGVQIYGKGELFLQLQEDLNDIFEKIPAPQPSITRRYGRTASRPAPSMASTFNNSNAVCVHGKTMVTIAQEPQEMKENSCDDHDTPTASIPISNVKKGDLVLTEDGGFARVQCLVETVTEIPLDLVQIDGLYVTPYHPVKVDNNSSWEFPIECEGAKLVKSDSYSVFNLVLVSGDRDRAVMVDSGIACITLGHGISDNATLKHDYFGTQRIVDDLEKFRDGWMVGHVILREGDIKRANSDGNICSIVPTAQSHASIDAMGAPHQLCEA